MNDQANERRESLERQNSQDRPIRADAQRNIDALLQAALTVFMTSGVDAPVREIAEKAGVGIGTVYRHFPQRSDLIAAVFRHEIDACADAATTLADKFAPFDALANWMQFYAAFVATKRGLAKALHSGDPTFDSLPIYFNQRLRPAVQKLVEAAAAAGEIRPDVDADDIVNAVAGLCGHTDASKPDQTQRMITILADGLRYGTNPSLTL